MAKKKEVKKAHILVESDYSPLSTHVYAVDKKGKKTEIPNIVSAKWEAVGGALCTLELKVLAKVVVKAEEKDVKKEEVPEMDVYLKYTDTCWDSQFGA